MKKFLLSLFAAIILFACSSPNHHVKYSNGNEDKYVHEKNSKDYVITMQNGDNTEGTLKLTLLTEPEKIEAFQFFSNWISENKGHSIDDAIVRMVKSTWIDAKYQLSNPETAKFNNNSGNMTIDENGSLVVFYDVFCKNGFGTEKKANVCVKLADKNSTECEVVMF